ncbi:FAD:protein FMN transferase, partial [Candidatus Margulisiibacteriota bacterium]
MKLKRTVFLFLAITIALFTLTNCKFKEKRPHKANFFAMGTLFDIVVYDNDFDRSIFKKCRQRVRDLEKLGNHFDKQSEISKINNSTPNQWLKIDSELFQIILTAQKASHLTKGAFDITVKPLIDYFEVKNLKKSSNLTSHIAPRKTMKKVGYKNILLDTKNTKIYLKN